MLGFLWTLYKFYAVWAVLFGWVYAIFRSEAIRTSADEPLTERQALVVAALAVFLIPMWIGVMSGILMVAWTQGSSIT